MLVKTICGYYRGRISFLEAMNLPIGDLNALYSLAIEESQTDEGKKKASGEILEDELLQN